ncbi:hypothetical protein CMV_004515 [Castanea mollissima]|uniref:Uncharacterized protein n=1 Tax=Castanea mollissima TaxID=60419 RepID=A0A8J4VV78_9ROSI|nr:hypothetical protein CMV_004515 [Castanea mollissima]
MYALSSKGRIENAVRLCPLIRGQHSIASLPRSASPSSKKISVFYFYTIYKYLTLSTPLRNARSIYLRLT